MNRQPFVQGALQVLRASSLIAALACPAWVQAQTPADAISREVSVYNNLSLGAVDAVSREVSVYNDLKAPPDMPTDAISREYSVYYELIVATAAIDSISREYSVYNEPIPAMQAVDAISREVSVEDIFHCTGDFTGDFDVTTADIAAFAQVLTGADTHPARRDAADINCDGVPDGKDIQPFVNAILSP